MWRRRISCHDSRRQIKRTTAFLARYAGNSSPQQHYPQAIPNETSRLIGDVPAEEAGTSRSFRLFFAELCRALQQLDLHFVATLKTTLTGARRVQIARIVYPVPTFIDNHR
jgi:hypothetical protein